MSLAKKCDCCGALYDYYTRNSAEGCAVISKTFNGIQLVRVGCCKDTVPESGPIDLCPDCMGKVLEALTIPQTETGDGEAEKTA